MKNVKTIEELNAVAHELFSVREMIKELEAEAESLTDQLKSFMIDSGEEVLEGDGWKASWKNVNSSRFDSKSFRAVHEDLYKAFSKNVTTTRFILN